MSDGDEGMPAAADELTPEARRRSAGVKGTPVPVGGHEWLLADALPALGEVWDRLFDQNAIRRWYDVDDLRRGALALLWTKYALSTDEAVCLVLSADPAALVPAVEAALFGPTRGHHGFSAWVRVSLAANGLDFKSIPAADLRGVLDVLVATGRTVPASEFISSVQAAGKRKKLTDMGRGG